MPGQSHAARATALPFSAETCTFGSPLPPPLSLSRARLQADAFTDLDDAANFVELRHALEQVGVGGEERLSVFRVMGAVLRLGSLHFSGEDDQAELLDEQELKQAAAALAVDEVVLRRTLLTRTVVSARGSIYHRPRNATEAKACVNSLSKALYGRLFAWLVSRINGRINGGGEAAARPQLPRPLPILPSSPAQYLLECASGVWSAHVWCANFASCTMHAVRV